MGRFAAMFNGITKSFSHTKNGQDSGGKEAVEAMAKDANKNDKILKSSGVVNIKGSNNFASVCSSRGEKGVNQDCCIVWEEFGCQEDMMFCGIFDGHGLWGHFVAKRVRELLPSSLLCNWQDLLVENFDFDLHPKKKLDMFNQWKQSFIKACAAVDRDLHQCRKIDSFRSGSTALTIIRQGDVLIIANVGDSRAVLATVADDGCLVPVQLTVDFKPNLPEEASRIVGSKGRVFGLEDEPGVHRVWLPNEDSPGLATSRAFGDFCLKDYGVISLPEVTERRITNRDHFVILASDGVWDVVSNEEAVEIVASSGDRVKAAKRLVKHAGGAWKRKRNGIARDDISAICIFFHNGSSSSQQIHPLLSAS